MAITEHTITKRRPQCGRKYPDEFTFCPDDAADLVPASISEERAASQKAVAKRSVLVVAVALLVCVAYAAFRPHVNLSSPGSRSTVPESADQGDPALDKGTQRLADGALSGWRTYRSDALGYSLQYPAAWTVGIPTHADAVSTRIKFQSPDRSATILVDVTTTSSGQTPLQGWQEMDARFRKAYKARYQLVQLRQSMLDGAPAATWEFVSEKKGGRLQKLDIGAVHGGKGFALLCTAPPADFDHWRSTFDYAQRSFHWTAASD